MAAPLPTGASPAPPLTQAAPAAPASRPGPAARLRRWIGESLERQLTAFTLALALAVLLPATGLSLAWAWRLERREAEARLDGQAELGASRLELALNAAQVELSSLARSTLVSTALIDATGWRQYALPFLEEHQLALGVRTRLALADYRGRIIAASAEPPVLEADGWLTEVMERGQPVALLHPAGHGTGVHFLLVAPVRYPGSGTVEGALVSEVPLAGLVTSAFEGISAARLLADDRPLLAGGEVPADRVVAVRPLGLGAPFAASKLAVEVAQPAARLRARQAVLAALFTAVALLLLAIGLALARRQAGRLTRPLSELATFAWDVSTTGALGARAPVQGHDETALLAAAFNEMMAQLEKARQATAAMHEAQQREAHGALRLAYGALERSSEAITIFAEDGTIAWANQAACQLLGRPREQVLGHQTWQLDPNLTEARWRQLWSAMRAAGRYVSERSVKLPGGETAWIEVSATPLELEGRQYGVSVMRDVTARRQAEAALRLAGVGTLAAGAAHEINNPLTGVMGNLSFVREDLAALAAQAGPAQLDAFREIGEALAEAAQGAERVRDVVKGLKAFSRPDEERQEPTDVGSAMRGAVTLARNELRHRARLVERYEDAPRVLASGRRLEQVFLNLLVNAAQALPDGPGLQHEVEVVVRAGGAGLVVAEVRDTGVGMAPEVRARIFEPFFTTKPVGAGTGLGLAICHGIVTSFGGRFEVESEPGHGTLVRVLLPAMASSDAPAARAEPPPPPRVALPAGVRILLVDDDALIARVVQRALAGGPEVVTIEDPQEALRRLRAGEGFDLVLCDLMMPHLSGQDFHAALLHERPQVAARMIFITGGAFTPRAQAFLAAVPNPCVHKPFDPDALRALVAERLAAPPPGPPGPSLTAMPA